MAPGSGTDPALDYLAGCMAGSANIVSGFPFDTVKVRLQAKECLYTGPWQAFRSIVRNEGVYRLYRGLTPPLVGGALETGVNYAVFQSMLELTQGPWVGLTPAAAIPVSAGTAGFFLSFILSPAELVKCRLQLGTADRRRNYSGPLHCTQQLVKEEGLAGLMRGLGGTIAREVPGNAVYFSVYELLRRAVPGRASDRSQPRSLWLRCQDAASAIFCGGLAGMAMWVAILPIDVAKTRIQTAHPGSPHDVGVLRQLRLLHAEGGLRSLYSGLAPTMLRAFPANAAQWLAWELSTDYLYRWKGQ